MAPKRHTASKALPQTTLRQALVAVLPSDPALAQTCDKAHAGVNAWRTANTVAGHKPLTGDVKVCNVGSMLRRMTQSAHNKLGAPASVVEANGRFYLLDTHALWLQSGRVALASKP